jgi:hypothetical protein
MPPDMSIFQKPDIIQLIQQILFVIQNQMKPQMRRGGSAGQRYTVDPVQIQ